ncbi:hypothetical protein ACOYW6_04465 [Parablastomonas sp. CN1-191]|uniref:hypothetical protein n=1 Tax=Parablastomonas sp. CN1-191 TaxID=3400908 RepID=UPI003BF8C58E
MDRTLPPTVSAVMATRLALAVAVLLPLAACGGRDVDTAEKLARAEAAAQRAEHAADRAEKAASNAQSSAVVEADDNSAAESPADPAPQDQAPDDRPQQDDQQDASANNA